MFKEFSDEELKGKHVLSASRLMALRVSPQNYFSKYILRETEVTEEMEKGKIIHAAVLEHDTFFDRYAVLEEKENFLVTIEDLKTRIGNLGYTPVKGKKEDLVKQLNSIAPEAPIWDVYLEKMLTSGKQIVNAKVYKTCKRIIEELGKHKWFSKANNGGYREVKAHWQYDEETVFKMVMDFYHPSMGVDGCPVVIDLKTTQDASIRKCRRAIEDGGMLVQAAIYVDAVTALTGKEPLFAWAFVEKKPPYHVTVVCCDFGLLEAGRAEYRGLTEKYKRCVKLNEWPGHDEGRVVSVGLSDYYAKQVAENYPDEYIEV